jgi:hypothetical protein
MEAVKSANLGLRFLLESAAVAALGCWGVRMNERTMADG